MMHTFLQIALLEFNVVLLVAYPYIIVGSRTNFPGWWKLLWGGVWLGEIAAAFFAVKMSLDGGLVLQIVGALTAIAILAGAGRWEFATRERQAKKDCKVNTSMWDQINLERFSPRTGFVLPHKIAPVLKNTSHSKPSAETLVKALEKDGLSTITIDVPSGSTVAELILKKIEDELVDRYEPWTGGQIIREEGRYLFFAFRNQNQATMFRLSYT